ncbi:hypothetical protein FQA39_LY14920 [Lamprigera yunnana]|nr:hypothetical protein FQA39_LY14920 [Lamprigera yunnana]
MDINRLLVEELDYELFVRGVSSSGTVANKRKLLRSRINLEKITKTSSPNVTLNFIDELRICDDKLRYIETELSTFASGFSDNEYRRIRTRLLHLHARIERIQPEDRSQETRRNELINRYLILFDDFETTFQTPKGNLIILENLTVSGDDNETEMDSIPTSCIQLAKEQIIKYSDPKYNINDLKTGDCETMLLNQTIYYLNKSKSKWISVGLYYPFEFASVVKIFGRSKQYVIFKEEEWIQFHEQRENINKYFQTFDTMWKPRQIGSKTLMFEMIEEKKILKIEDMSGNEVYLGWESVSEVWSLESVLRYRLSYSSGSNFKYSYEDVIRAAAEMSGDVKININNIINRLSEKSDDKYSLLKKMWMLYAQEHWTKSYDLKSAVERLYEELGALEFDADDEAIYGMERYYTVQQCEELRDKYKIGRKVCRKFLQGKTCSQCLVKRISEIGLRHFLDTINKYIKDCSDSSSSSDE